MSGNGGYTMCDNCQNAYEGGQDSICYSCKNGSCYKPKEGKKIQEVE